MNEAAKKFKKGEIIRAPSGQLIFGGYAKLDRLLNHLFNSNLRSFIEISNQWQSKQKELNKDADSDQIRDLFLDIEAKSMDTNRKPAHLDESNLPG